jgi:uncharacterized protein
MQRDLEKVADIYDAYGRRRFGELLQFMSPEVEVWQSPELPWGGTYVGLEGVRQFLTRLNEHLDSRVQIERLIDAGEQIAAVGRTVGKARKTNLEFDVPVVHVWTFSEGQVVRFESFIDNATMLVALGCG